MAKHANLLWALLVAVCAAPLPVLAQERVALDLPAQPLAETLRVLGKKTETNILIDPQLVKDIQAPAIKGKLTADQALRQLLAGTTLSHRFVDEHTIVLRPVKNDTDTVSGVMERADDARVARLDETRTHQNMQAVEAPADERADEQSAPQSVRGTPEILVKGSRSLNTDIQRTEDDVQPYVVFDRRDIERSQATTVEEFIKTRLPMNTTASALGQSSGTAQTISSTINLRGLGTNQTLILVNGRRMPSIANFGSALQPDLNGIPVAAIERIEVLPATASGIYGGGATGGVINIVLRQDYQGVDVRFTYLNTFDTDAARTRLDVSGAFSLGAKTEVMIAASGSEANNLMMGDRDFPAKAIALQLRNNPGAITDFGVPLGETVNIRSVDGSPLVLKSAFGGALLGSPITHLPVGYQGVASDSGQALVRNAGQFNLNLPDGVSGRDRGLMAAPSIESASVNVRHRFTDSVEAFVDLTSTGNIGRSYGSSVTDRATLPASAPNNPFLQDITVRFPSPQLSFESNSNVRTTGAVGGLIVRLPGNWMSELSYNWSRVRFKLSSTVGLLDSVGTCVIGRGVAANVDPDGAGPLLPCAAGDARPALNVLQEQNSSPLDLTPYLLPSPNTFTENKAALGDAVLRFSGPTLNLPGGPMTLSAMVETRDEVIEEAFTQRINSARVVSYGYYPERKQNVDTFYAELHAPLISARNAKPFLQALELQLSARQDRYTIRTVPDGADVTVPSRDGPFPPLTYVEGRQKSSDYTAGVRYSPVEDLTLRASLGSGFLPPSLRQIASSEQMLNCCLDGGFIDPARGFTPLYVGVPIDFITGGRPNLEPEQSRSLSTGFIAQPRLMPGLRVSLDYVRIRKTDEIQNLDGAYVLANEDRFPGRVVRGPKLPDDPASWRGPVTLLDVTLTNIAETAVDAFDTQADYTLSTRRNGEFHVYLLATRQVHFQQRVLPEQPIIDSVGFTSGPLKWRGNFGLDWSRGPFSVGWNAQYYDSYLVYPVAALPIPDYLESLILNQGSAYIPRQIYHDLVATWRFDESGLARRGLLSGVEVSLGLQNVLNTSPPILASTNPIDAGYSTYGDPMLRRYSVSIRKSFGR